MVVFHLSSADCSECYSSSNMQTYLYLSIFNLCFLIYVMFIIVNISYLSHVTPHICSLFISHNKLVYFRCQTSWCPMSNLVHNHDATQKLFNNIFLSLNCFLYDYALIFLKADQKHNHYHLLHVCKKASLTHACSHHMAFLKNATAEKIGATYSWYDCCKGVFEIYVTVNFSYIWENIKYLTSRISSTSVVHSW
jgi:hypothetical protein